MNKLHFSGSRLYEFSDSTHWAKLRIKRDKFGLEYADLLIGWKGDKKWHAHLGINLDQSIKFEQYRGVINSVVRNAKSLKKGKYESFAKEVDSNIKHIRPFVFEFTINVSSAEIVVSKFEFK